MKRLFYLILYISVFATVPAHGQWIPLNPVVSAEKTGDGVTFTMQRGLMKVQVSSDSIFRVMYSPTREFPNSKQYVVIEDHWPAQWTMQSTTELVIISTGKLKATVTRKDGSILFADSTGKKLFEDNQRTLSPVEVNGGKTY